MAVVNRAAPWPDHYFRLVLGFGQREKRLMLEHLPAKELRDEHQSTGE
jgi:hypothetical protein